VTGSGGGVTADVNLTEVGGATIALGQAAMAASLPVVIASNQTAVPVTLTPSGTQDVNLTQTAGVAVAKGHGTAAAALRVELPTDGTGVVGLAAGSAVIGHVVTDTGSTTAVTGNVTVVQSTASSLNATVTGTGAAGTAATGVVTVQGIASMTKLLVTPDSVALPANQSVNLAQVAGTNTVNGGVAGSQSVGGTVATNVAITANPLNLGAQAVSSENAAVTTARQVQLVADLVGKLIVLPYANPENFVSGTITSAMTGTTTTSLLAAPASGLRNYITQITVSNGSTTVPTDILIQDGSGGTTLYVIPAPTGTGTGTGAAGASITFPTPLRQPTTATAIFVANVTTGSSTKVSASGYKGI